MLHREQSGLLQANRSALQGTACTAQAEQSTAGPGHTCSLKRLLLLSMATLTAVTLVMKESMGSTVSLVTAMMKASQLAFTCFSNSFLLSTCTRDTTASLWRASLLLNAQTNATTTQQHA